MLETTILDQVRSVFQHLEARYVFHITYHPGHEQAQELIGFLKEKSAGRSNSSPHPGVARRHQPANVCIAYLHQLSGCGAGTEHHRIAESARHPRDGGRGA